MLRALTSPIRRRSAATAVALLAAGIVPLTALPARAAVVVTTCNDSGPGSLREAVILAPPGDDTITFALACATITLTSGEIVLNQDLTITGPGAATLTIARDGAAPSFRIFNIAANTTVAISGVTITNGRDARGGGILNAGDLTVTNSTLRDNHTFNDADNQDGGGIANSGTLTVTNSTLTGNTTGTSNEDSSEGGGIFNSGTATVTNSTLSGNTADEGGGISNSGGTLTVTNSTLSGNSARDDGGGILNGSTTPVPASSSVATVTNSTLSDNTAAVVGGGIANRGTATVTNSTLSGNTAIIGTGGGVWNFGTATLTNSTLSGNSAGDDGGGIRSFGSGTATLARTIVANNTGGNCLGTITDGGSNLEYDDAPPTCGFMTNAVFADPLLGPLTNNGGPTMTHALLPNSPAIDAAGACNPPITTDQRGVPGPHGPACDIGAYESAGITTVATPAAILGQPISDAATVTGLPPAASGMITFTAYGPDDPTCTTDAFTSAPAAVTGDGVYDSGPFIPTAAGTYRWVALYSGDIVNPMIETACDDPDEASVVSTPGSGGGGGGGDDDDDDDDDDNDGGGSGRRGRVTIVEDVRPDRDVTFGFHTKNLKATTFRLEDDAKRQFKDLKAGTYTVAQDTKDGWKLDKIVCRDPSGRIKINLQTRRAVIKLKAGEHVTCTFTNKKN